MSHDPIIKVAVRTPVWRDFDYLYPEQYAGAPIENGQRIKVPFGKREVVGIVIGTQAHSDIDQSKLKAFIEPLEDAAFLNQTILKLSQWASDYYHFPLGEVLFGLIPKKLRETKPILYEAPQIDALEEATFVNATQIELSEQQQQAIDKIQAIEGFGTVLLHGITGSGKTEIYLRVIEACLRAGKQALVLVPEISLTPQTVKRFEKRFSVPIAVLHSGLTDKKRLENWHDARVGHSRILIGTRSAIFAPLKNLGVIVVDEEHDASFKQQSGFRYSARDVSIVRARMENVPVILGSATPSIESLHNAWQDRYQYLTLPERAGNAKPPRIKLLDIRREKMLAGLSESLINTIDQHIADNGQALIFLNRRGYSPVLMCHECGFVEQCPHCDIYLTYHQKYQELRCHHCEYTKRFVLICQDCHQADLAPVGQGTERLEDELVRRYGEQDVVRIDRDTTRKKGSLEALLEQAHARAKVLIGTQMLSKGHHFQNLTLVAVVDADNGLFSTDFRAQERLAQLLVQVSGRAGREDKVGEVIIQTHQPEHPMWPSLLQSGYTAFIKTLLIDREQAALPPYSYLALFRAEDRYEDKPKRFLSELKQRIREFSNNEVRVLGPVDAAMPKRAGRFRAQLLLQSEDRLALQRLLRRSLADDWLKAQKRKIRWSLDVDPVEL